MVGKHTRHPCPRWGEEDPLSLRERKKAKTRRELGTAAAKLFCERGFDATTIEDIVAVVGVSRRTFFRYFPSKEAAFFARQEDRFDEFRDALRGGRGTTRPWSVVCDSLVAVSISHVADRDEALAWRAVLEATPQLRAYDLQVDAVWEAAIREELCLGGFDPLEAAVRAGALMGAGRAVLTAWHADHGRSDIRVLGRRAVGWLDAGFRVVPDAVRMSA
jgi:AcrR family transcriptional regulator